MSPSLSPGTKLGRYEIVSLLGAGGMGEVYHATDVELGRPAALKFLRAEVAADQQRMNRFMQEARAASALNHPNILTVYDIGQAEDGTRFFAAELIDGETLRERLQSGVMKLGEVLDVAIQIASALVAAHAAGIVHRDIKPENVMIRRDGYVKVLDFGLAKLTGDSSNPVDTQAATRALVQTDPGSIMGTVAYMSPEQAAGRETDARTDIWSLGVVLYEMLAGRVPFAGKSLSHTIVAILDSEPPPLARFAPDAPESLQEIVSDALAKDPEARFQTAKQMLAKLRRLKGRLDAGAHLDHTVSLDQPTRSGAPASPAAPTEATGALDQAGAQPTVGAAQLTTARSLDEAQTAPGVSSAEYVAGQIKNHRRGLLVAVALAAVALAGFGLYKYSGRDQSARSGAVVKITPLTSTPGVERGVAFSPDGRQVAFTAANEAMNFDIYVKLVGAGEPLRLTSSTGRDMSPAFSPDGRYVAFLRGTEADKGFYLVPALGGAERKLADAYGWNQNGVMAQALDWSPDGRTLAVVDKTSDDEPWSLFLLSVETGERRRLTTPPAQFEGDTLVAFSPDGSRLAFTRSHNFTNDIYLVPVAGGEPARLTSDESTIHGLAWMPGGAQLVFSSERGGGNPTLWKVSAAGGAPAAVAGVGENVLDLAVSRQGDRLAYAQLSHDTNIYRLVPANQTGGRNRAGALENFISSTREDNFPQFSPDGRRVAFVSSRSGTDEVWTCDAEGKNALQLTHFGGARIDTPNWSPDGRYVAFNASAGGSADIYVVSGEGGSPARLTNGASGEGMPSWSRDGRTIYFASSQTGRSELWKMPAGGGAASQLTRGGGTNPRESFDGRTVYFVKGKQKPGLWQVSAGGGEETQVFDARISPGNWGVTEKGIYFLNWKFPSRMHTLERFDIASRRATQVAIIDGSKPSFTVSGVTVSPDERALLIAQRDQLDFDLVLVENFR